MQLLPVFSQGEKVLAAVSGGADSVCLLRLLIDMRDSGKITLCAAHLNHGIRAGEADDDQAFVEALCKSYGVPLAVDRIDVPALARSSGMGLETQARIVRREFLLNAMTGFGADVVATGHHALDQAETVLMHLLRGGGLRGAGGMRAREDPFARPLLETDKQDILDWLHAAGQPYRDDSTNFEPDNPRNRLRLNVMGQLDGIYPGGCRALGRFARIAAEADDMVCREAHAFLDAHSLRQPFGASLEAVQAHPALVRRALMLWAGLEDFEQTDRLYALYRQKKGALELNAVRYERSGSRLYRILPYRPCPEACALKDNASLAGLGFIRVQPWQGGCIRDNPMAQAVDADALKDAVLRTRRPGDRMRPLGASGTRKLSDVFIDRKIDRPLRDYIPLVARGSSILWAVGVGLSQDAAITDDTAKMIRLEWKREDKTHERCPDIE